MALGLEQWQCCAPLYVGDMLHVELELNELRRTSEGLRLLLKKSIGLR